MKKLKRIVLNPSCHSLDSKEMADIVGGISARATSCSISCGLGTIKITNCIGTCIAEDQEYVVCKGVSSAIWKYCYAV